LPKEESATIVPEASSLAPIIATTEEAKVETTQAQTTTEKVEITSQATTEGIKVEETSITPVTVTDLPVATSTEVDKLIERLEEIISKASETTTELPSTSTSLPSIDSPVMEAQFVNFTVSVSKGNEDETRVKRSLADVDFISKYLKHSAQEKDCVFGDTRYKLGESIKTVNDCVKCICEYAPIGHCIFKDKCNI